MKRFTVTLKDNDTGKETTASGDNLILSLSNPIPNSNLLSNELGCIGGEYTALCRNLTALARHINETFCKELSDEDKAKIEKYEREKE